MFISHPPLRLTTQHGCIMCCIFLHMAENQQQQFVSRNNMTQQLLGNFFDILYCGILSGIFLGEITKKSNLKKINTIVIWCKMSWTDSTVVERLFYGSCGLAKFLATKKKLWAIVSFSSAVATSCKIREIFSIENSSASDNLVFHSCLLSTQECKKPFHAANILFHLLHFSVLLHK